MLTLVYCLQKYALVHMARAEVSICKLLVVVSVFSLDFFFCFLTLFPGSTEKRGFCHLKKWVGLAR